MKTLIVVALVAALASPGIAPGVTLKTRTVREDYVGSADPLSAGVCRTSRIPANVGKVCIPLKSKDRKISIAILDQALGNPAFFYMFIDSSGGCLGDGEGATGACPNAGSACGSISNMAKPRGAVKLEIFPSGAVLGTVDCTVLETADSPGPSAAGTITTKIQYLR